MFAQEDTLVGDGFGNQLFQIGGIRLDCSILEPKNQVISRDGCTDSKSNTFRGDVSIKLVVNVHREIGGEDGALSSLLARV